ncbi:MAG TPA: hypothetical protein VLJ39_10595 [Tepidisphaeraceae bacterium]|nr:hypothetical protein [Tepidisphaeraceae bacterium]
MKIILLALLVSITSIALAEPSGSQPKNAELPLIAAPTFKEPLDASFSVAKGSWVPADGILTGAEVPADKHVAVLHHNVGLKTAVVECEFKLDGSPAFLVGCNGKGHIGRVVIKPTGVDIAEDSAKTSHVIASLKMPVAPGEWHKLRVEWTADQMSATLDGKSVEAKNDYLARPKAQTWFAVPKTKTEIRNLTIRGEKTDEK